MFESQFQTFTNVTDRSRGAGRLKALRAQLKAEGLDGFVIPRADEYQNEYVPPSAERLAWLTGFAGSAGTAVVLSRKAAIFVDGRYTLQVREQVDGTAFALIDSGTTSPEAWIGAHLPSGGKLGYDPWLMTVAQAERLAQAVRQAGGTLVAVAGNPLDAVWSERPQPPLGQVFLHRPALAGESASRKLKRIAAACGNADALFVSDAHSANWAFNIRGRDISFTPLALCTALVPKAGRPRLYIDARKLSGAVQAALSKLSDIVAPDALLGDLARLGAEGKTIRFDAASAPSMCVATLREAGGTADVGADPVALMKARKNDTELAGTRAAHLRDGAALVRFLAWLDIHAPKGGVTEIGAAKALETFRRETGALRDLSFPAISGFGPHSALPHYRVSEASDLPIGKGMFLIDSGAQYEDGTTDITRTVAVGKPTAEMRDRFTRVLKGHIAIARAVFPSGATGAQIDSFARVALWEAGLDFDHGTGHGIGSYLSVHEGPQRIAKTGTQPLLRGMIVSNEPGYYKEGAFGIRIENLIVVEPRVIAGAERQMLGFETISFAPIDLTLVEPRLMTPIEIRWLDAYHAQVRKLLSGLLDAPTRAWLAKATRKVAA